MEDFKGGSQNIKGEQEEDQSLPTEDMGGGGRLWEIDYKSTTNEGEGDLKNITEPYKGIR